MFIWSANPVLIKKYNKNKEPIKALLIYSAITKGDIFITEEVMSFDEFLMASLTANSKALQQGDANLIIFTDEISFEENMSASLSINSDILYFGHPLSVILLLDILSRELSYMDAQPEIMFISLSIYIWLVTGARLKFMKFLFVS